MQTYRIYVFDCIFGFKSLKTYDFVVKLSWWSYTFDCFWINVWSFSFSWFFHRFDCCFCGFLWFFFVLFLNHFSPKISSIFLWFLSFFSLFINSHGFQQRPFQATLVIRGCAEEMGKLDSVAGKALRLEFGRLEPLEPSKMVIFTVKNGGFSYGTCWFTTKTWDLI